MKFTLLLTKISISWYTIKHLRKKKTNKDNINNDERRIFNLFNLFINT